MKIVHSQIWNSHGDMNHNHLYLNDTDNTEVDFEILLMTLSFWKNLIVISIHTVAYYRLQCWDWEHKVKFPSSLFNQQKLGDSLYYYTMKAY